MNLIRDGDSVVLDERGEKSSFIRIKAAGTCKVGKAFLPMAPLVGAPFGSLFQVSVDGKSLVRADRPVGEYLTTTVQDTERDNSSLFDRNVDNQKLAREDVEALKRAGKSGEEIVEELCSNSATFDAKTEFSQEKYKRKKAKKYIMYVTARQPTARAICQAYYDKGPDKVFNLRVDTLAIALSLANVAAGTQVLIFDNCMGVVLAAALERMGGLGAVCAAHVDKPYCSDAVRTMNLDAAQRGIMCTASLAALKQAKVSAQAAKSEAQAAAAVAAASAGRSGEAGTAAVSDMEQDPAQQPAAPQQQAECSGAPEATSTAPAAAGAGGEAKPEEQQEAKQEGQAGVGGEAAGPSQQQQRPGGSQRGGGGGGGAAEARQHQHQQRQQQLQQLVHAGFASCIVAAPKLHAPTLLQQLLPLLRPSAPFVVFSPWVQPLAEAMHALQTGRQAVLLQLQESWMRPHQVLPMRTHPEMTCSGTGGYLLSGIKVSPDAAPAPAAAAAAAAGQGAGSGNKGAKRGRGA